MYSVFTWSRSFLSFFPFSDIMLSPNILSETVMSSMAMGKILNMFLFTMFSWHRRSGSPSLPGINELRWFVWLRARCETIGFLLWSWTGKGISALYHGSRFRWDPPQTLLLVRLGNYGCILSGDIVAHNMDGDSRITTLFHCGNGNFPFLWDNWSILVTPNFSSGIYNHEKMLSRWTSKYTYTIINKYYTG